MDGMLLPHKRVKMGHLSGSTTGCQEQGMNDHLLFKLLDLDVFTSPELVVQKDED
jgi:hypothetical protein